MKCILIFFHDNVIDPVFQLIRFYTIYEPRVHSILSEQIIESLVVPQRDTFGSGNMHGYLGFGDVYWTWEEHFINALRHF